MSDVVLETIERPDGTKRILVVRRADGCHSYRAQFQNDEGEFDATPWPTGYPKEAGWGPPGPYLGIYDSAETAKWEALGNVEWLSDTQPRN
jgi:hypothetical protein